MATAVNCWQRPIVIWIPMHEIAPKLLRDLVRQGLRRPQVAAALGMSVRSLNYRLAASNELRDAATPVRSTALSQERPVMKRCREGDWRAIRRASIAKSRSKVSAQPLPSPEPLAGRPGTKLLQINLQQLTSLIADGTGLADTAAALGISRATLLRRRRTSPEVRAAIEEGRRLTVLKLSEARLNLAEAGLWPAVRLSMLLRVGWIESGFGIRGTAGVLNERLRVIYSGWQV